jgi:DNA-binding SARP family transcriptional activator/tetratricopeptide (TPR) repeat protein
MSLEVRAGGSDRRPGSSPESALMRIELLGPVRAWRGEDELTLGSAHRRAVLAVLATRANSVVSRAELIDAVWGEHAPASANGSIYTYVSGLRAALEPDRSRRSVAQVLVSAGSGYTLQLAEDTVDADRFDALREQAKRCQAARDTAGARKALDEALALWHGDALDGIPGPFAASQRSRLAELRLTTLERRAQVILDSGGHHALVDELSELTGEHPLREGLHGLLLLALYRSDRRADALKVFRELRTTTVETLGTEPGPALTALNEQILTDDPALVRAPESPGGPAKPIPIVARPRPNRPRVFVGREAGTRTLRAAVRKVCDGAGGSIWIEGEPGIGKSALLAHALAETPGCQLAWASADELGQRFPLRVVLDCLDVTAHSADPRRAELAKAARRSENIAGSEPVPAAVEGALALVEELCEEGPLILVADELQWADPASLLVWQRLSRATRRLPLLLIGACRPVPRRHELEVLRAALPECGTDTLVLEPLSDVDVHDLITGLTGSAPTPALLGFGLSSAGNPLYVKEIVATLARENTLDVERAPTAVPATLVSMISHHLTFLSARTRKSLRWAALFGEAFTSADLAAALGREVEEVADIVDEARAAGVFAETHGRLAFRHPLVRRALYDKTPAAVRVALHRQLAEALANAGAPAERVAEQLTAAPVPVDPWVRDWLIAEIAVLAPRAPLAAMRLLRRATTSGAVVGDFKESLTATMARLMSWLGQEPEAEASYVCARTADGERAAEMRWILARLHYARGDLPRAIGGISEALRDNELSEEWRLRHNSLLSAVLPAGSLLSIFLPPGEADAESPEARGTALDRALDAVSVVPKLATLHRMLLDDTEAALHAAGGPRSIPEQRLPEHAEGHREDDTPSPAVEAYWQGRWDDALAELSTALGSGPVMASYLLGPPGPARLLNGVAALVAAHRGEPEEARAHLRAAGEPPSPGSADTEGLDLLLAAGALIAEQEDRPDHAFDLLATMLEPDHAGHEARFAWLPTLVRLAMDLGERGRARFATLLCEGTPGQQTAALRCRALLDDDPAPMLAAAERSRLAGRLLESAQALEDAAILLADRGRMSEADETLRRALVSYTGLGARWDVQRAERRMRGRRRG